MHHVVFVEFNRLVAHSVGAELLQILTDQMTFALWSTRTKSLEDLEEFKFLHPEVIKAKFPIKEVQLACYLGQSQIRP